MSSTFMTLPTTPTIEIHLAHDDNEADGFEIHALRSPYSPKLPSPMAHVDSAAEDFRPRHLLPPPSLSPISRPPLSNSGALPADKKGIDGERFALLLKNSRERAAMKHGRKEGVELRKQVTLKAHTIKALERRALFLSKIQSPPSPGAADSPATPPESPAVFHFTLPSPGMQSPLAVFESLSYQEKPSNRVDFPCKEQSTTKVGWIEEVDFKARARRSSGAPLSPNLLSVPHSVVGQPGRHARRASAHGLPSLDQITARLALTKVDTSVAPSLSAVGGNRQEAHSVVSTRRPRLNIPTHRRSPSSPLVTLPVAVKETSTAIEAPVPARKEIVLNDLDIAAPRTALAPVQSRLPSFLQKRTPSPTPTITIDAPGPDPEPTAAAIVQPPQTIRRTPSFTARPMPTRLPFHPTSPAHQATPETRKQRGLDMVERLRRRSSAPAGLPPIPKQDTHRVLGLKGGF